MAFELVLEDAKLMANICSIISSIVTESIVIVDEEGIKIRAFDATRISLIDFFMKKEAFKKYKVKETSPIGLSLETLNTILKTAKANESLLLALDEETNRFMIEFTGENQKRNFALPLLDLSEETVPDSISLDLSNSFEIKASFVQQVLKDAELVGDHLRIKASHDGIFFGAIGEASSKEMNTFIGYKSDEMDTEKYIVGEEEEEAIYSLDFLSNFLKGVRSSDFVNLAFSEENPIRINYDIEDKGHMIYYVAPRIEDSEDIDDDD